MSHRPLLSASCLQAPKSRMAQLLAKGNHHVGAKPWKRCYLGHVLLQEPKRSLSAHVTGTQAVNFSAQNQGAAAELKLTGPWVGTDDRVGSQKLQTGGLQNKMCWKPLSEMSILLSFSLFFPPLRFGVMVKSELLSVLIVSWMLMASLVAGLPIKWANRMMLLRKWVWRFMFYKEEMLGL